ncbi:hypothetical protein [Solidesulfovibrio sp.]
MESVTRPVPALVPPQQAAAGDGCFVPAAPARTARGIPAPFAGLRWRLVPDLSPAGRTHADP